MCTAISDKSLCHIFGRTLDLEYSLGEAVVITPRRYPLGFLHSGRSDNHFALIGAAHLVGGLPLYYDAANEHGLCAAALSFPRFAEYRKPESGRRSLASFELIPWVLSQARSADEARRLLADVTVTDESFSDELPATPLHWIFSDAERSIVLESTHRGVKIEDCKAGVLANSPDLEAQLGNLERYARLIGSGDPIPDLHSRGLEDFGIPGDFSSGSRFVRAVYLKARTAPPKSREEAVSRFFHIMDSVSQPSGATRAEDGTPVRTVYTSAIDSERREYFFTTYENRRIRRVRLDTPSADGSELAVFPMHTAEEVGILN